MNAHSQIADSWSTEYEFEEIEIEEDGVHFGSFWGVAQLALNDARDGDFYVRSLAVAGQRRERQNLKGYSLSVMKRTDAVVLLTMPAKDDRSFRAHLFRKLESALYASRDAQEWFQAELDEA